MFFTYNNKLYFGAEDGESYPVTRRRNRLIISSTSAPDGVEGVDRVYDIQELRLKLNVAEIISEHALVAQEAKEELEDAKAGRPKRKVGKPATKAKKKEMPIEKEEEEEEIVDEIVESESEEVEAE